MQNDILRLYLKSRLSLFSVGEDYENAEYIVFGVPFDSTTTFIPGCRFGPLAIRIFSENIDYPDMDEVCLRIADLGDLVPTVNVRWMLKRVYRVVEKIIGDEKKPIILGGEHTLTLASLKALAKHVEPTVIIFDAHLDLRSEFMDTRINHATWLRRFLEKKTGKVAVVGCRDFSREELEYAEKNVDLLISTESIEKNIDEAVDRFNNFLKDSGKIYVSIDLDVLEQQGIIGVSNPSPRGLTYIQINKFLNKIPIEKIIGLDVVEANPLIDRGVSASHGAHLIFYIIFHQRL
ncbi:MAG: arginase family protein [Thaumarchaeota archaeon]|jgi:agmatinase|nr:arginase family protein [Candidatus Geocrenenecus arthurdayi]MCL7391371.1 arginase family protein [Candidatus Geocrenenecus arthurdayi]MCL7396233.1 arginase family protein [Candidatus Geocrenenecus arthurdayi]MCL7403515.1 arginase family protein [Candidatus Geocrenenecus arthurdayi]